MSKTPSASTAPTPVSSRGYVRQRLQPRLFRLVGGLCLVLACPCHAQRMGEKPRSDTGISVSAIGHANLTLPDAPTAPTSESLAPYSNLRGFPKSDADPTVFIPSPQPAANPTDKYIAPGQLAPKQTVTHKILLGLKDAGSAKTIFAAAAAAGISHADDSSPSYGRNSTAYAQRFGAAMARGGSYSIFSDSIMASVLHEDPRYYRLGKSHKLLKRVAYAVTRPVIGRTNGGHTTPNLSLIAGHLSGAYLTQLYYPPQNTSTSEVFETFGYSLMGSAIEYGVNEFVSGAFNIIHNSRSSKD